ncbi:MAG: hypothetical protein NTU98_07120 [Bacteroidetes bacterium]|nr:hypothetical protein [Bacteroidota bacterium]
MTNQESTRQSDEFNMRDQLNALENRISILEKEILGLKQKETRTRPETEPEDDDFSLKLPWEGAEGVMESKFGEYGLAFIGNIVLFLGIVFLTHFISTKGYPIVSFFIGIVAFAGMMFLARFIRKSYQYLAFIFTLFAHILLFYTVARLHYFTTPPVISNNYIVIGLLLVVAGYQFYEAIRRKSEGFAVLALLTTLSLAIISNITPILLLLVTVSAITNMILFWRFGWSRLLTLSVILTYLVFFIWFFGNPLMTQKFQMVGSHHSFYIYLALVGAAYSMVTLVKQKGLFPDDIILSTVILNGLGFSALLGSIVLAFFPTGYIMIFVSIAVFCLGFSAVLKFRSPWKYSPALYALYSFMSISIALYGLYGLPKAYLFLAFQSLLVVSMALWFRSRIIIVMNLILFIFIMIGSMSNTVSHEMTNFAFPVVAFFSARIINWQRERLNIKTEVIRNTYLVILFITMLYALYKAVPGQYITLSWTLAALFYFLLSLVLKNVKYRYMMFATLIATMFYLFAVDLAKIGMVYQIIAFLFLAIITIGISVYYVNKLKAKNEAER